MDNIYKINIERAVLSSILFNPDELEDIMGVLKAEDFSYSPHVKIFDIMVNLHEEGVPIHEDFIRKKINPKEIDESIILEILSANPITNTMAYVKDIKNSSVKRELATLATTIKKVAIENDEIGANEALDIVQSKLYKISTNSADEELKDIESITTGTLSYIKKMKELGNKYLIGETTGFESIDRQTTGFNSGDLIIVAARPAMGKTAFVLNIALKNVELGKGVVFFSLEMPAEQLMLRMLSVKTSIALQNLRKGDLSDEQWENLSTAVDDLSRKKFFVDDGGSVDINQLRARVRKIAQNSDNNVSMVVIDYLQLMQGVGNKDRHQEVSDISRGLKMLARELKIPIIALSQLNRGLENRPDKRPMLSDLRESGAIEQDADIIMFVYRDDVYKARDEARKEKEAADKGESYVSKFQNKQEEETEIIVGKQRNGPIGTRKLIFQKNFTRFVDKKNENEPDEIAFENMDIQETKIDLPSI